MCWVGSQGSTPDAGTAVGLAPKCGGMRGVRRRRRPPPASEAAIELGCWAPVVPRRPPIRSLAPLGDARDVEERARTVLVAELGHLTPFTSHISWVRRISTWLSTRHVCFCLTPTSRQGAASPRCSSPRRLCAGAPPQRLSAARGGRRGPARLPVWNAAQQQPQMQWRRLSAASGSRLHTLLRQLRLWRRCRRAPRE